MDTVYRTLWWLKDLGLIKTFGPPRERTRFDTNLGHHHHFICTQCGLTHDFHSEKFNKLKLPESVQKIGQAEMMQVEVKGVCRQCAAKELLVDRAQLLTLTAPEMTVLVGGMRV